MLRAATAPRTQHPSLCSWLYRSALPSSKPPTPPPASSSPANTPAHARAADLDKAGSALPAPDRQGVSLPAIDCWMDRLPKLCWTSGPPHTPGHEPTQEYPPCPRVPVAQSLPRNQANKISPPHKFASCCRSFFSPITRILPPVNPASAASATVSSIQFPIADP